MIFNKELDKSLYLILKFDKKNRQNIIRLLSSFPSEFYNNIINMLQSEEEKKEFKENYSHISLYCLVDKTNDLILDIKMYDNILRDKLELCLCSSENDKEYLGTFSKSISKYNKKDKQIIEKEKNYEYSKMTMPKEELFIKTKDYKKIIPGLPMIRDYKEGKIPKELTLSYINDKFNKKIKK